MRYPQCVLIFLLIVPLWASGAPAAWGLDLWTEAAVGYDDNAAEVPDGEGSGFARYRLRLDQPLAGEIRRLDAGIHLEGAYTQYLDLADNSQVSAGGDIAVSVWNDRLRPEIFVEAMAFRDDLVAEDERDAVMAGGGVAWLADARLTLALRGSVSWADYRNEVFLPGGNVRAQGHGMGPPWAGPDDSDPPDSMERDDAIEILEVGAILFSTPDLTADLRGRHRRVDSTAEFESGRENGLSVWFGWTPAADWAFFVSGSWARFDYDATPDGSDRSDDLYEVGAGGRRFWGDLQVYLRVDRTENDSPLAGEEYDKTVTQCGLAYSF